MSVPTQQMKKLMSVYEEVRNFKLIRVGDFSEEVCIDDFCPIVRTVCFLSIKTTRFQTKILFVELF